MKICIPIKQSDPKKARRMILEASETADLAEIWLDQLKEPDHEKVLSKAPLGLVACCKRGQEQGDFIGTYEKQAEILMKAIDFGVKYIDLPLFMPEKVNKKVVQYAHKKKVKVIISHHDFKKTPSVDEMQKIIEKMKARGADIVKIAVQNKRLDEAIKVLAVGKYAQLSKTPHILIGMGQEGKLTRILSPTLGGEMMFAVLSSKSATAPGQLTVSELRQAWKLIEAK